MMNSSSNVGARKPILQKSYIDLVPKQVYSFNPRTNTARLESIRTNRLLMRRYATVQKARDADVFGILVGTLGVGTSLLPLP